MELNQDNYSKEEVENLLKDLTAKVTTLSEGVTASKTTIDELTSKNLTLAIESEVIKSGLDLEVIDLVTAEDLEKSKAKIVKLKELQEKNKKESGYVPEGRKSTNDYENHESKGNVSGMLLSKINKIFN